MYRLVFLTGKFKGKRLAIKEKSVKAGRSPDCAIQLPDGDASRQHALFEEREDGVYVKDLGATNQILVNDKPVREARLTHGDRIELGSTLVQYQVITRSDEEKSRTTGHAQSLTAAAVAIIILSQIAFLLFLIVRHKDAVNIPEDSGADPAPVLVTEVIGPEMSDEEETFAQAEALLAQREEMLGAEPAEPEPDSEIMQDLRRLRAEVEDLRQQVESPAEPEPAPEVSDQPAAVADPLIERAQAMLNEALTDIVKMNFVRADEQLARIQLMAPDFIPAYIERARLHERRGQLKQAGEQWTEVLNRSMGTPLYEQAAAERMRIARAEMTRPAPPAEDSRGAKPSTRLPRRIRIADIQQERFPKNDQFEEMRLLRVSLKPHSSERNVDAYHIQVAVTFFDEDTETKEIRPTRAVVPRDPLRVDGDWRPNQQKTLTAAYIIPRGFRDQEIEQHGERMLYLGYIVQVYYRQELQDVEARPKILLNKQNEIPSPFHKPPEEPETPPDEPPQEEEDAD